jgi:hypothetical protein
VCGGQLAQPIAVAIECGNAGTFRQQSLGEDVG